MPASLDAIRGANSQVKQPMNRNAANPATEYSRKACRSHNHNSELLRQCRIAVAGLLTM